MNGQLFVTVKVRAAALAATARIDVGASTLMTTEIILGIRKLPLRLAEEILAKSRLLKYLHSHTHHSHDKHVSLGKMRSRSLTAHVQICSRAACNAPGPHPPSTST